MGSKKKKTMSLPNHRHDGMLLLDLVQGQAGKQWADNRYGWNATTPVCHWQGVACFPPHNGSVISVNVAHSGLSATIAPSIANMTTLRRLILANNSLHGTLPPAFASLLVTSENLARVDLSHNQLHGTLPNVMDDDNDDDNDDDDNNDAAERAPRLQHVDLSHNNFTGTLSEYLWGPRLTRVFLAQNQFGGTLPSSIGTWTPELQMLDLSRNELQGKIPDSLWTLPRLETVHLYHNRLMGMLPSTFENDEETARMSLLTTIALYSNFLSGTIPSSLAQLPALSILLLDDNKLTGTVPSELCLGNVNHQLEFDSFPHEDSNKNGIMPLEGALELHVQMESPDDDDDVMVGDDDAFAGFINNRRNHGGGKNRQRHRHLPTTTSTPDSCHRILCPAGYRSSRYSQPDENENGSEEEEEEGSFCHKCSPDSFNPYLGARFCKTTDERTLLDFMYFALDGPNWDGNFASWQEPDVKTCDREGIACNKDGNVMSIELPGANLRGTLPEQVGYFRHLRHLDVSNNELSGTIPGSLHLAPLRTLQLKGNRLEGQVPPMLCQKEGINGNGYRGIYSCNAIACAVGSFNALGRADPRTTHANDCFACVHGGEALRYLGSSDCILRPLSKAPGDESQTEDPPLPSFPSSSEGGGRSPQLSESTRILLTSLALFFFFGYCYFRARAVDVKTMQQRRRRGDDAPETKTLEDLFHEEEEYELKKSTRTANSSSVGSTNSSLSKESPVAAAAAGAAGGGSGDRFLLGISTLAKQSYYHHQEQEQPQGGPSSFSGGKVLDEESTGCVYHVALSQSEDVESLSSGESSSPVNSNSRSSRILDAGYRPLDADGKATNSQEGILVVSLDPEEEDHKNHEHRESGSSGMSVGKKVSFWDTAAAEAQETTTSAKESGGVRIRQETPPRGVESRPETTFATKEGGGRAFSSKEEEEEKKEEEKAEEDSPPELQSVSSSWSLKSIWDMGGVVEPRREVPVASSSTAKEDENEKQNPPELRSVSSWSLKSIWDIGLMS